MSDHEKKADWLTTLNTVVHFATSLTSAEYVYKPAAYLLTSAYFAAKNSFDEDDIDSDGMGPVLSLVGDIAITTIAVIITAGDSWSHSAVNTAHQNDAAPDKQFAYKSLKDPTDPSKDPTDPSKDPTDPSKDPTDPSKDPTDPSKDPTDLSNPSKDPTDLSNPSKDPTDLSNDEYTLSAGENFLLGCHFLSETAEDALPILMALNAIPGSNQNPYIEKGELIVATMLGALATYSDMQLAKTSIHKNHHRTNSEQDPESLTQSTTRNANIWTILNAAISWISSSSSTFSLLNSLRVHFLSDSEQVTDSNHELLQLIILLAISGMMNIPKNYCDYIIRKMNQGDETSLNDINTQGVTLQDHQWVALACYLMSSTMDTSLRLLVMAKEVITKLNISDISSLKSSHVMRNALMISTGGLAFFSSLAPTRTAHTNLIEDNAINPQPDERKPLLTSLQP